jgi:UPF0755 protein
MNKSYSNNSAPPGSIAQAMGNADSQEDYVAAYVPYGKKTGLDAWQPTHDTPRDKSHTNATRYDSDAVARDYSDVTRKHALRHKKPGRPRSFLTAVIVFFLVVACAFGFVFKDKIQDVIGGNADYSGQGTPSVSIEIPEGSSLKAIARILKDSDVVKSVNAFVRTAQDSNSTISTGTYILNKQMSAQDALEFLTDGKHRSDIVVQIPEGKTVKEVFSIAASASDIPISDFEKLADDPYLIGLPAEADGEIEGWLFPSTYSYPRTKPITAEEILSDMVSKTIATLDSLEVKESEREDVLKKASIAQMEVNSKEYFAKVARVIDNRLDTNATGHKLGMDTVNAYGLGKRALDLTQADLETDNPYNSRIHPGLPPTPIANPGEEAIYATLHPAEGDWIYFITVNLRTGETKFTNSSEQFEEWVQEMNENMANDSDLWQETTDSTSP